jgi:hypothetical protein
MVFVLNASFYNLFVAMHFVMVLYCIVLITSRLGPIGPFRDSCQVNLSCLVIFSTLE